MTTDQVCPQCGTVVSAEAIQGLCPRCLGRLGFGPAPGTTSDTHGPGVADIRRLGDYELIEEIARGGMGIVYRARQVSLNRMVALKVVLHGPFSSPEFVQRFRTEAEVVAGLRHPNIVAIHEIGEEGGHQFFSMELIEGRNLAELVRDHPLPAHRAAAYLRSVAQAIQYAHDHGVLHRDLKPSNVLLDAFDQPRVTDFGLAKMLNRDAELTTAGQVLGSPGYMPPEQAEGKFADATPQADIYSLGAILYHLLTGRPPFQGETLQAVLIQVQSETPVSPRRLNPGVPLDLQTICLKCLEKGPARRYASAQALADDLDCFLTNKPICARPASGAYRLHLWCRRHPISSLLSAALALAIASGVAGVLREWRRAQTHAAGESRARLLAEQSAAEVRLNLYAADISLAWQAIQNEDWGLARRTLERMRPPAGQPDLRGFEWRYLWGLCRGDQIATLTGHQWIVTCAAFSPDGRWLATGSQDGTTKVWDVAQRALAVSLPGGTGAVWSVQFSPDGSLLLSGGSDGDVLLRRTGSWEPVRTVPGELGVFSRSGTLLAISGSNPLFWEKLGEISLWDYRTGEKLIQLPKSGRSIALSPDGATLAVAAVPTGIDFWETSSGRLRRSIETPEPVYSLAFSPDGRRLVSCGWSHEALVWRLDSTEPPQKLAGHRLTVWSATFSPDGTRIATTGSDQSIRLWNADTLKLEDTLRGHDNEVWCAAFSPDGKLLASGSKDQTVMLWSTAPHKSKDRLPSSNDVRPAFSPDGLQVLTRPGDSSRSNSVVWSTQDIQPEQRLPGQVIGFTADGKRLIGWDEDGADLSLALLQAGTSARVPLESARSAVLPFAAQGVGADFREAFAIDRRGCVRIWEVSTGGLLASFAGPEPPIRACALDPAGRYLAVSVERENTARLYDVRTGQPVHLQGHRDFVSGLAFSPDGSRLATGSMDGTIRLWQTSTGAEVCVLPGHMEEVTDVAFSPDGRTLASLSRRESVKFWHMPTRRELFTIDMPHAGGFLQFSPDGRVLAVSTEDDVVRFFRAPAFSELDATDR